MKTPQKCAARPAAVLGLLVLVLGVLALSVPSRSEIIVKLEVTAERAAVHLEPNSRSPVLETLPRGAVVKQSSAMKFRTNWYYVQFQSSRSGRLLAGYVQDGLVRKLNSTLKIVDLTPTAPAVSAPKEFNLEAQPLPAITWGMSREGILKIEGRPIGREESGAWEFLRYRREVFGKRCHIAYVLANRCLVSVRVSLLENYADKDRYVSDYNQIRDYLNHKIGEPRYDNVVWSDRAYAERGESLGQAVNSGCLSLSSEWVTGDTGLRLSLTGEPGGILFAAEINDIKAKNPASF
jgi:hypothetical protein